MRSRVSSELHSRQEEDEDEVVQDQDDCFHLIVFFQSILLLGLLDLVLDGLQLRR